MAFCSEGISCGEACGLHFGLAQLQISLLSSCTFHGIAVPGYIWVESQIESRGRIKLLKSSEVDLGEDQFILGYIIGLHVTRMLS